MADSLQTWLRGVLGGARSRSARGEPAAASPPAARTADGPWLYTDPLDRTWVLSMAPLEHDPTLPADCQPKALVCTCQDGWIFAVPTGPGFRPDRLEADELSRLLVVAEGDARRASEWEPSRSDPRTVMEPATGRVYQAQRMASGGSILFRERGGTWSGCAPLPEGGTMEGLSREDLLWLLRGALDPTPQRAPMRPEAPRVGAVRGGRSAEQPIILLVDDEVDIRVPLRDHLERAGFGVLEAADGEEALALVARYGSRLRAVVTDLVMPRVGGRELRWRLSEQYPELPVILMSGFLDGNHLADAVDPPPAWFLPKPFSPAELVEYVRAVLSRSRGTLLPH